MNKTDDEKLIERFFSENPVKIDDDGFTRRVMHRLPDRMVWLNRLWTACCAVILVLVIMKCGLLTWLSGSLHGLLADVTHGGTITSVPVLVVFVLPTVLALVSASVFVKQLR